jgi:hypothetical protein
MLKRKQSLQQEQKELLSATISAGTLSLLNIALILGLLMQDYNINSPNINGSYSILCRRTVEEQDNYNALSRECCLTSWQHSALLHQWFL